MNVARSSQEDHDLARGADADTKGTMGGRPAEPSMKERSVMRAKLAALIGLIERWSAWTPVAAALVVFARFVHLGWYAQPQADDFDYSVLYTRYGFWGAQVKWFYGWNGRYFFNAATTAAVVLFDPARSYWAIPTLMFALMFGAHYHALREALGGDRRAAIAGAVAASALLVVTSPVRSDAYYWATGVTLYPLANCAMLLWLVSAARLYATDEARVRWRQTASLVALAFVIIGCNETSMLVLDALVACACVIALRWRRSCLLHGLVALAFCGAFSLLVVKAPGNLVRESFMTHRADLRFSLEKTTEQTKELLWAWSTQPLLLLTTLLAAPAACRAADRARARFPGLGASWVPVAALALTGALVWVSVFPSWWSKGAGAIPRTLNVSYAVFLMGWAIAVGLFAALRVVRFERGFARLSAIALSGAAVYVFLTHDVYAAAVRDLATSAPVYRRELRQRYAQIRAAKARGDRDVVVEPITSPPSQLFILDLFACTEGWPNSSYAEHFGLRSIRPRGASIGSCGAVPPAAQGVVNPYSIHLFKKPD